MLPTGVGARTSYRFAPEKLGGTPNPVPEATTIFTLQLTTSAPSEAAGNGVGQYQNSWNNHRKRMLIIIIYYLLLLFLFLFLHGPTQQRVCQRTLRARHVEHTVWQACMSVHDQLHVILGRGPTQPSRMMALGMSLKYITLVFSFSFALQALCTLGTKWRMMAASSFPRTTSSLCWKK